ncbi:MAG: sulfite reductase subunit alpha [Methylococcales bacterium]|nr:sulfite reductase subunit alpha [Methylococcaceae bacterium]
MKTPKIPDNTPYSDTQRAWLGGFFAGMHSHMLQSAQVANDQKDGRIINILYGTQTGNAESVADDTAATARNHGLTPIVKSMDEIEIDQLAAMEYLLIITSTYGEGEMPDNAQLLWDQVSADSAPKMDSLRFSILALGDTSYDEYCKAGIDWDNRLVGLGAERIYDRMDCDVDFEDAAEKWITSVIPMMAEGATVAIESPSADKKDKAKFSRKNPYVSKLLVNRLLTAEHSTKETRHYEFCLADSGLSYEAGDALNIIPQNCPELVADIIKAINCTGDEDEPVNGELMSFTESLLSHYEIKLPSKELIQEIAQRSGDQTLNNLLEANDKAKLSDYLWGRDTLDLLLLFPEMEFSAAEFLALLKPLQHRAYSISSSGKAHPESVHLTVASVRYQSHEREHKGVCSTYIADLIDDQTDVKIFFSPNKSFRVPADDDLPIIMVGPGTGIAPFRAFLQEREFRKAKGKNWLLFGDRNEATDYIYRDEIEAMQQTGVLSRLDLAFSRDQQEKIYVQDRMRENAQEMFSWLELGGYFYVCGDANYMAKDVDKALHKIIETQGNKTADQAIEYVNHLKKEKRYVRDVY